MRPAVPLHLQNKLLSTLKLLCKKTELRMDDFSFEWEVLWDDIMVILGREGRHEPLSSELNLTNNLHKTIDFLHGSRMYLKRDSRF